MATKTDTSNVRDIIFDQIGFKPTREQQDIIDSPYRFNLVAGGEQAGKSMIASKFLLKRILKQRERDYIG